MQHYGLVLAKAIVTNVKLSASCNNIWPHVSFKPRIVLFNNPREEWLPLKIPTPKVPEFHEILQPSWVST